MEPTPVRVIVTERDEAEKIKPQTLETPKGQADLRVVPMTPFRQAFTRATRAYAQNVLWRLTAALAAAGVAVAAMSMADIPPEIRNALTVAFSILVGPLGPAAVCFLQNWIEITTKMDSKNPELRA